MTRRHIGGDLGPQLGLPGFIHGVGMVRVVGDGIRYGRVFGVRFFRCTEWRSVFAGLYVCIINDCGMQGIDAPPQLFGTSPRSDVVGYCN